MKISVNATAANISRWLVSALVIASLVLQSAVAHACLIANHSTQATPPMDAATEQAHTTTAKTNAQHCHGNTSAQAASTAVGDANHHATASEHHATFGDCEHCSDGHCGKFSAVDLSLSPKHTSSYGVLIDLGQFLVASAPVAPLEHPPKTA